MDKKGQGALEYLLLIGGAVLVAVIVITLLLGITDTGATETNTTVMAGLCRQQGQMQLTINPGANVATLCATIEINNPAGGTITCSGTAPHCTYNPAAP